MPRHKRELPAGWILKRTACQILKVGDRQLQRRIDQGFLQRLELPRLSDEPGATVVVNEADVLALKAGKPNIYPRVTIVQPGTELHRVASAAAAGAGSNTGAPKLDSTGKFLPPADQTAPGAMVRAGSAEVTKHGPVEASAAHDAPAPDAQPDSTVKSERSASVSLEVPQRLDFWRWFVNRAFPASAKSWLTVADASERSGLPPGVLRRLAAAGEIVSYEVGTGKHKRRLLNRESLDQWKPSTDQAQPDPAA